MAQPHDPMAEIRASFFVECDELLEALQDGLLAMEDGTHDDETINTVFRAVHSVKGGAGAFGLTALVAFAHRLETVFDALRAGRVAVSSELLKLFFRAADLLSDQVRAARDGTGEPAGAEAGLATLEAFPGAAGPATGTDAAWPADFVPLGLSLRFDDEATPDAAPSAGGPDAEAAGWTIRFRPTAALYASGNEPLLILRALAALGPVAVECDATALPPLATLGPEDSHLAWTITLRSEADGDEIRDVFDFVADLAEISIEPGIASGAPLPSGTAAADAAEALSATGGSGGARAPAGPADGPARPAGTPQPPPATPPAASRPADEPLATVRVDLERIDRLVNLVGELAINQAMLAQSVTAAGLARDSAVTAGLDSFMMLTRDIQDSVMMIRAQPVKPLFQRMARIVREAALAVGKDVRLRTEGEATEVDKTVIERLADPLTHMIRNAVDHGLESPEARRSAGKPPEGQITLSAAHRAGRVIIDIRDDGAGIDRARVRETAIRNGLAAPDAQLSEAEIDALLFRPGFSTAATVSNLSGRGVGMDVVKRAIQGLGGRITIASERGRGTLFSISLPLTLAVLDGLVVEAAGETLVVPLSAIVETALISAGDIRALGPETGVIHIRGGFVPLYDLGVELGFRAARLPDAGGIVLLAAIEDGSRVGIIVDAIVEQRQVVIKGLQQGYGPVAGIAAATILGDGRIALILDPADLVRDATGRCRGVPATAPARSGARNPRQDAPAPGGTAAALLPLAG